MAFLLRNADTGPSSPLSPIGASSVPPLEALRHLAFHWPLAVMFHLYQFH